MKNKTNRMTAKFAVILMFACMTAAYGQNDPHAETKRLTELMNKLEGTYQIQIANSREKTAFPLSTLDLVEAKRKTEDTVYFWINPNMRIMVLPKNEINKKDFKPVPRMGYVSYQESK